MADLQQPVAATIAIGNIDSTGASNGATLQGTAGAVAVKSGTGLIQVTLQSPNDVAAGADIVASVNPGFGSSKGGGGLSTTMSSFASGAFTIEVWDQTTVPPVPIDGPVHFVVRRKYNNR